MINSEHMLSIRRQCELLGSCRSSFYYEPVRESEDKFLRFMRLLDEQYLYLAFLGRRIRVYKV